MPENHLYEYAVVRLVPQVEREEFLNIGVVLYCAKLRFLEAAFTLDADRLKIFSGAFNMQEVENHLRSFEKICQGGKEGGAIGMLPNAERFREYADAALPRIEQQRNARPRRAHEHAGNRRRQLALAVRWQAAAWTGRQRLADRRQSSAAS